MHRVPQFQTTINHAFYIAINHSFYSKKKVFIQGSNQSFILNNNQVSIPFLVAINHSKRQQSIILIGMNSFKAATPQSFILDTL